MALPRSEYVKKGQVGVYHCFSRCVRRAFLYGFDRLTNRDYSHRKQWLVDRLRHLAAIFAVEVCAYAVMANHYHTILRVRPDIVANWSDREVATRWLTLCPKQCKKKKKAVPSVEEQIHALTQCPERIAELRERLSSLSWFMAKLNEFIARAANKEDAVTGRFWESRFSCKALLDEAAIAACMVYVDLNPIRAKLAGTLEESDFTSIQERIRAWQKEMMAAASVSTKALQNTHADFFHRDLGEDAGETAASWLCPISSEPHRRGILSMTAAEYFDLVDTSGRLIRTDKPGAIDADLAPILLRIGANPEAWAETITCFGNKFSLVVGLLSTLRNFADQVGRKWVKGIAAARAAFAPSPPQVV
jgi:putative transposase